MGSPLGRLSFSISMQRMASTSSAPQTPNPLRKIASEPANVSRTVGRMPSRLSSSLDLMEGAVLPFADGDFTLTPSRGESHDDLPKVGG